MRSCLPHYLPICPLMMLMSCWTNSFNPSVFDVYDSTSWLMMSQLAFKKGLPKIMEHTKFLATIAWTGWDFHCTFITNSASLTHSYNVSLSSFPPIAKLTSNSSGNFCFYKAKCITRLLSIITVCDQLSISAWVLSGEATLGPSNRWSQNRWGIWKGTTYSSSQSIPSPITADCDRIISATIPISPAVVASLPSVLVVTTNVMWQIFVALTIASVSIQYPTVYKAKNQCLQTSKLLFVSPHPKLLHLDNKIVPSTQDRHKYSTCWSIFSNSILSKNIIPMPPKPHIT